LSQNNSQKTILITGASTGIGLEMAKVLGRRGYKVYAGVRKSSDAERIKEFSPNIHPIILDITKTVDLENAYKVLENQNLYGLFNNAGVALAGPLELSPMEEVRWQMEVNVNAQVELTQKLLPLLKKHRDSRIIFTGSQSGFFSNPYSAMYCASKHALEAIADAWRFELKRFGVKVILFEPGAIKTPIFDKTIDHAFALQDKYEDSLYQDYKDDLDLFEKAARNTPKNGSPVEVVGKYAIAALERVNPKTRYRIGIDAKVGFILSRILPFKWRDWLVSKAVEFRAK